MKNLLKTLVFAFIFMTLTLTACKPKASSGTESQSSAVINSESVVVSESIDIESESQALESESGVQESESNTQDLESNIQESESNTQDLESEVQESDSQAHESESNPQDSESDVASPVIEVVATVEEIEIKDENLNSYDFTKLFSITEDGQHVSVKMDFIVLYMENGNYVALCSYKGQSSSVTVIVIPTVYEIALSVEEITLHVSIVEGYDFLALFSATKDGEAYALTKAYVTTNVATEVGVYSYTVTLGDVSKTLTVIVTDEHDVEIFITYPKFEIAENEIEGLDATILFSVYVDGEARRVTADMIDSSALLGAVAGNDYEVVVTVTEEKTVKTAVAVVRVIEESQLVINAKNLVVYPNSEYVDLTQLFSITKGDEEIPVTADMVSGSINYNKIGENVITLTYKGETRTAIVEVKRGVIITPAKADTIVIKKGTEKEKYAFENDFKVLINGIRFTAISEYINIDNVNFNEVGEYTATIKIPYNDQKLSLSGVKFTYYEASITYVVVESEYSLSVKEETVVLPLGTQSYYPFNNVHLVINGRNQSITDVKEYVDAITCYAEILSGDIDFSSNAVQSVKLAFYVYGVNQDPVIVEYNVVIKSDIEVTATGLTVFAGATVYTKDLFTITENGEDVEVTQDMITGKVDTFVPGLYTVVIDYKGFIAESKVVVLDSAIVGTYRTLLTTIQEGEADDEYGNTSTGTRVLRNLFYYENGSIMVDGANVTLKGVVDESTTMIELMRYEYTMYYSNGIIVLNPDNSIRLPYNNQKRPMVYFHNMRWNLSRRIIVNSTSTYVLDNNIACYSFDIFEITDIESGETFYFALRVELTDKSSVDTVYNVSWGFVDLSEDFLTAEIGAKTSLSFNGKEYKVVRDGESAYSMKKATSSDKIFASKTFEGEIDGQKAYLRSDVYEGFTLQVGEEFVFKVGSLELGNMKNGGPDYDNSSVFLYGVIERTGDSVFSYKFNLDLENNTFTVVEKDAYFGHYQCENSYIFLDGYGTGVANFNTTSFYKYSFEYTVVGNKLEIKFVNTPYDFEYGTTIVAYIENLLNVLTITYSDAPSLTGLKYVNQHITDGAIVEIASYKVGAESDTLAKPKFLDSITITTKDGVLEGSAKTNAINTSLIKFSKAGFYQFTITVEVGGEQVVAYYALQVLAPIYEGNSLVATYGNGVVFSSTSLTIDKYGQAIILNGQNRYDGLVTITEDNAFVINAKSAKGESVRATGGLLSNGLVYMTCTGASTFSDYYTTGSVSYAGVKGFVLRVINVSNEYTYIVAPSATSFGCVATVEVISGTQNASGSIMKITADGVVTYVKLDSFGSIDTGLTLADDYRGEYLLEDDSTMILDGFGKVSGDFVGAYTLYGRIATVNVGGTFAVYRLDNSKFTAQKLDVKFDMSLVAGKTYTASHIFYCDSYPYTATTTFEFKADGSVIIKSTSSEHDEGSDYADACTDLYNPTFASKDGVTGSYSVSGNKITVNVNGQTFVFEMLNVVATDSITCVSTTASSTDHGYFAPQTNFILEQ